MISSWQVSRDGESVAHLAQQRHGEAPVGGRVRTDRPQPRHQRLLRVVTDREFPRRRAQRLDAVVEHRFEQHPARREVPVQRRGTDGGLSRDLLQ
jgi:hypothetical protein